MQLLTAREAAVELGVTPRAVRRYCRNGSLRARKYGAKDWVIRRQDLNAELTRRKKRHEMAAGEATARLSRRSTP